MIIMKSGPALRSYSAWFGVLEPLEENPLASMEFGILKIELQLSALNIL
jgi:hypothetical protein